MPFANPWGLLALLSLPAILAIHLFHRRHPPLQVAGLHLWSTNSQVRSAGRRRERLPITRTLLLELMAALLFSLLLAQPRFEQLAQVTHLVVVLDNSASMGGRPPGQPSFRDTAIEELQRRAAKFQRGSVVTLITTGRRPTMLAGPAVPWAEAERALDKWNPAEPVHEFHLAWDLGTQLAEQTGELLFLTDRLPEEETPLPNRMETVAVGRSLENIGITTARWTIDTATNQGRLFLQLSNHGRLAVDAVVTGRNQDRAIFEKMVSLPAQSSLPLESNLPGGLGELNVTVTHNNDGLEIDNHVTLVEPRVRLLSYSVSFPPDETAGQYVHRVLESIPDLQTADSDSAQLIIGRADRLPESRGNLWWLGIGPIDRTEAARNNARNLGGRLLVEKRNPLVEGVVLEGVIWGGVQPVTADATPLISSGTTPLLARLNQTQATAYVLNIDLQRSNLAQSPDWPILISNLVMLRRDSLPGLRRWNYRLNETIQFRLFEGAPPDQIDESQQLWLDHKGTSRQLARTALVELPVLSDTGIYTLRDGETPIDRFAVNFHDPQESTLLSLGSGARSPAITKSPSEFELDNPFSWVVLAGLVLILVVAFLDWHVLKPKLAKTEGSGVIRPASP